MMVMEDIVVQLSQASLELQTAWSKWLRFSLQDVIGNCKLLLG